MDFDIYVESIIEKMKDVGYYSEIDEKDLKNTLNKYLKDEYQKRIELAGFKYDLSLVDGEPQSMDDVKKALADIKSEMVSFVRDISKTKL